ncbi:MAG: tetratricopeptide repeat protein, partial [Snowella sp.]
QRGMLPVRLNPNAIAAKIGIGRILLAKENYREAVSIYQELNRLDPNNPDLLYYLGLALKKSNQTEKATTILKKSRDLYEKNQNPKGIEQVDQLLAQ